MNTDIKTAWVAALRSGEYKQTKGMLVSYSTDTGGDKETSYCCLGVLCDLAVKAGVIDAPVRQGASDDSWRWIFGVPDTGDVTWSTLPRVVQGWAGLLTPNPFIPENPDVPAGETDYRYDEEAIGDTLAGYNDKGHGFEQIADIIEGRL